ncbi:GTP-binding protein [Elioraea tepida]|jgi:flagellar biosynthesis protein FlhF|uniref:GTP-binding protein n=1 Tax=Elioraea tepida TaxID=2843330 RepID=A0A975U0W5_9PROT|nr:GTP-binding protein [Elioraea tepida]QXM24290.1 GTP-binding protein [Elioraea tepida]
MRIRVFRARTAAAAMAAARAELGAEALILGTRRVAEGIELTAAAEPEVEPAPVAPLQPVRPAGDPAVAAALAAHGVPERLRAALASGPDLAAALSTHLRFEKLPLGRGSTLLVVGPPGSGKTLTVAKLATRLRLAGRTPRVIAADGRRTGAVEQLAAFTRLLGLDLIAAPHPATVLRALAVRTDEPTLIDTAGIDPFDPAEREEIAALAAASGAAVAVVLAAGMDAAEAAEAAEALAETGARHVVATRFDIARRVGALPAAAHAGGLAVAEAGTGPGAADGLGAMTAEALAARLMAAPASRQTRAAA